MNTHRRSLSLALAAITVGGISTIAGAQADVSLCVLHQVTKWGTLGDITAYSVGTTSVNVGNVNLNWVQSNNNHPVISQNMYRVLDGTIEQIGQSWLKHSFCALQIDSGCSQTNCPNHGGCLSFLAPGCQDPYSAPRNGSQTLLGPKWQVNPHTGIFPYPPADGDQGATGNLTYMRLQVHNSDLGNSDATYLVEGQYVAKDDAAAGNQNNNNSYRLVTISAAPNYNIGFVGGHATEFQRAAIFAWSKHGLGVGMADPDVSIIKAEDANSGLFWVGSKVSDNGNGTWHYEYAVQNVNNYRNGGSFTVPIPAGVNLSNIGFHDVDYHSGDGPGAVDYDGTDWAVTVGAGDITWSTDDDSNAHANALRWGTLYNFRFDADVEPEAGEVTIGLWATGTPDSLNAAASVPSTPVSVCPWDCASPEDGEVTVLDFLELLAQWGQVGTSCDFNGGGVDVVDFLEVLANWGPCP